MGLGRRLAAGALLRSVPVLRVGVSGVVVVVVFARAVG